MHLSLPLASVLERDTPGVHPKTPWHVPRWPPKPPTRFYAHLADRASIPHQCVPRLLRREQPQYHQDTGCCAGPQGLWIIAVVWAYSHFVQQILDALLEVRPFKFALDVAALASRREYLNLDKWLADNVTAHGADFLHAVIAFLELKMDSEKAVRVSDPPVEPRTMQLSPQTIAIFLRVLRNR